ncbi:hypothetical protein [Blautia argi]|uniref:hypothetical protein n=1 Tax=Blautia argi TaxID=1912897 RepID=UPI002941D57D|nr:hypothetical protein [Blautia argi]
MTERQCFEQCIPQIAETIIEARKMTAKEYYEWKAETIRNMNEKLIELMKKTFLVIEEYLPALN